MHILTATKLLSSHFVSDIQVKISLTDDDEILMEFNDGDNPISILFPREELIKAITNKTIVDEKAIE